MTDRAIAVALFLCLSTVSSSGHPAQASVPPVGAAGPPSAGATCVLRGVAEPRVNASLEDAQGRVIARLSGAATALVATDFPADSHGRVRVQTGTGAGGFRIRGFLATADLPLRAALNVPVIAGHVWIAAGRELTFLAGAPGRLRVERHVGGALAQNFVTWAPCNLLTLASAQVSSFSPPSGARAFALKKPTLEIFDQPSGALLTTLTRASGVDSVLFFSSERRGEWVNVSHHGDVIIEAWARARDLVELEAGETLDQPAARSSTRNPPHLSVQGEPRVVKPVREVPLRANAKETDSTIGVIEPGAETYVLDVVAGWASVMPKALNVVPGPDGQFWVKATDLGI
jgi:hypothetical protein